MTNQEFRKHAHQLVDWMADYLENVKDLPVLPPCQPGDILKQLPQSPNASAEAFEAIFEDFQQLILPNMTHWQSPNFFAYFPANASYPSILAEMLTATMGAQCMVWQTSPAAEELEVAMMQWLAKALNLPENFHGVIQDTASTATLCAFLSAREQKTHFTSNQKGLFGHTQMRIYCSEQTHSSIEKAAKIAGLGAEAVVYLPTDDFFAIDLAALSAQIQQDRHKGMIPLAVVANIGTTSTTAVDNLAAIGKICKENQLWLHVDAAFAGTACILEEKRPLLEGITWADSFVFNPHKWMFTNFDCSAYFVADPKLLVQTLGILPEYLKTGLENKVKNFRDWSVPLGRRFRALKLWFVIRSMGLEGIKERIRFHLQLAQNFSEKLLANGYQLHAPVNFNLVCFSYPFHKTHKQENNHLNEQLLKNINASGSAFISHTKLNGNYVLRAVFGQTSVNQVHVDDFFALVEKERKKLTIPSDQQ